MQVLETNFNGYIHKVQMATHGLCVTSSDNETNVNFFDKFLCVTKSLSEFLKNKYNLYIIKYFDKVGKFNSLEKYYGIWKRLNQKNILYENSSREVIIESDKKSVMVAYSIVNCNEINNLLNDDENIIAFATESVIHKLFDSNSEYLDCPEHIKEMLLNENSCLIEYLDLGSEGMSLFVYSKRDNIILDWQEIKNVIGRSI